MNFNGISLIIIINELITKNYYKTILLTRKLNCNYTFVIFVFCFLFLFYDFTLISKSQNKIY